MVIMVGDLRRSAARQLRERGVSFRQVAERFGVRHQTVENWIYGSARARECGCGEKLRSGATVAICGFCVAEAVEQLTAAAPRSTEAVWALRDVGLSARAVVLARDLRRRGASVSQVSERILGALA